MGKWLRLTCVALMLSGLGRTDVEAQSRRPIVVSDADGLQAALTPANAGRRILVQRGTYFVHAPLVLPDGVTLEGEGLMLGKDLPEGFEAGTETRIVPDPLAPTFAGDLLTLGHASSIRDLIVEDVVGRTGNVVAVHSRAPGDRASASIVRCEIINPKSNGAGPDGPLGRAVTVLTQNRSLGAVPPPDEDAEVGVALIHSVIRSSTGSAIFAINFASRGDVTVVATSNRIYGSFEATGGVSRPDAVTGASITVRSERNLYSGLGGTPVAWTIDGGSGAPVPGFVAPGTSRNIVRFTSVGDEIEGFGGGVFATAGKRHNVTSGLNSGNIVDLRLIQLRLATTGPAAADFVFHGAGADGQYAPGNRNILRVLMIGVVGSGPRQNSYADEVGAGASQNLGTGNRLEIVGNAESFSVLNHDIAPAPPAEFFLGER